MYLLHDLSLWPPGPSLPHFIASVLGTLCLTPVVLWRECVTCSGLGRRGDNWKDSGHFYQLNSKEGFT